MTEEQYRQLLRNRHAVTARSLFAGSAAASLLRAATQSLKRREAAERALDSILQPTWLAVTRVEALERGTLVLAVSEPLVYEQMRRQTSELQRQLACKIRGLRRLLVTCSS